MAKKPLTNQKYKDVKKVLDTGKTINDIQLLSDQFVSKRKNEFFKRIRPSTVVKLIGENNNVESIYNLADENNEEENIYSLQSKDDTSVVSYKTKQTDKTDLTTKTSVTAITYATEMLGDISKITFLLLDLREKDDYNNYHIKEAISFHGPNISRDKYSSEMITLVVKNNKILEK